MLKHHYARLFSQANLERYTLFFFIVTVVGMPISSFLMSLGSVGLAVLWLISGNWHYKIDNIKQNKTILPLIGIALITIVWVLFTDDYKAALREIKNDAMIIPFVLVVASIKITSRQVYIILNAFVIATIVSSLISLAVYFGIYTPIKQEVLNIRNISIFISHIRLGLMCVLSVVIIAFQLYRNFTQTKIWKRIVLILCALWLIYFVFLLQTATSWFVLFALFVATMIFYRKQFPQWLTISGLSLALLIVVVVITLFTKVYTDFYTIKDNNKTLPQTTSLGNKYYHDTTLNLLENGYYVHRYICQEELKSTWDSISLQPYNGYNKYGNSTKWTLIRFLTSKGYTKDREGVLKLTAGEIIAVEQGCASCIYLSSSNIYKRFYESIWEVDRYIKLNNPNNKSLCMRIEFMKAAVHIIKNNFWFGIGTGDIKAVSEKTYEELNSPLEDRYRKVYVHNQFIFHFASYGLVGFLIFMCCLFFPFVSLKHRHYIMVQYFILIIMSMLNENTLGTQAGMLLFIVPYTLLYCLSKQEEDLSDSLNRPF